MNVIDIVLGAPILFGIVYGFKKGLFVELASLVALIVGIYGAIHFSYVVGDYLGSKLDWDENYINISAFAITFIILIVLISLAGKFLTKIADYASLGTLNKILGGLFGGLKFAVILGAIIAVTHRINESIVLIDKKTQDESVLYTPVKGIGSFVFQWVLKETERETEQEEEEVTPASPPEPTLQSEE